MRKSFQHTITYPISCSGIGVHSGKLSTLTFNPTEENFGIVFKRTDITDKNNLISANFANVNKTKLGTTITNDDGVEVATIEHLMAALWGAGIDNCLIEIDNIEVPVLDGSSEPFVFFIQSTGIKRQKKYRKFLKILKKISVEDKTQEGELCKSSIEPSDQFIIDLTIDFKSTAIGKQQYIFNSYSDSFLKNISRARTYGQMHEVEYLRSNNLALGGSLENAIVVDNDKILNPEGLRSPEEFVKHKIVDCIGDLYLSGNHILGKFTGYKSGHCLNNKLLKEVFSNKENYKFI